MIWISEKVSGFQKFNVSLARNSLKFYKSVAAVWFFLEKLLLII